VTPGGAAVATVADERPRPCSPNDASRRFPWALQLGDGTSPDTSACVLFAAAAARGGASTAVCADDRAVPAVHIDATRTSFGQAA
jgi:hypothetical protein